MKINHIFTNGVIVGIGLQLPRSCWCDWCMDWRRARGFCARASAWRRWVPGCHGEWRCRPRCAPVRRASARSSLGRRQGSPGSSAPRSGRRHQRLSTALLCPRKTACAKNSSFYLLAANGFLNSSFFRTE